MRRSPVVSFVRRLPIVLTVVAALACGACGAGSGPATTLAGATSTPGNSGTGTGTSSTPALAGTGKPTVTIGDKNYTEQFVLGQLYLQALQAQGFTVNINENIGPTEVTVQALKDGTLAMYPEYLDIFNSAIAGDGRTFRTQLAAYAAADRYALGHGLELLEPTPFSDTDAIVVTDAYAADNELHSIRDLRRVATSLTIGGPPQFQRGSPGLPEIKRAYGVTPAAFKPLAVGDQYDELDAGTVQAADVNTTDGQLASGDYVLLSDPRQIFGFGNVVPVISAKWLAAEGPAFADTIDRVDETLTTATMRELNSEVDIAKLDPASVAKQFLETHGLLTPSPAG